MIRTLLIFAAIAAGSSAVAQNQSITWGDEFKLKKGSNGLKVIHTDNHGVYLQEEHTAIRPFNYMGGVYRGSASLVKLDSRLGEIYRNDFNKELRGKEFDCFFPFREKLLLVAAEYHKGDHSLQVYAAEIDKASGELSGTFKPLASFQKEERRAEIEFRLIPNADTTRLVLITSLAGREKNTYEVQEFDKNLKPTTKPTIITNEFEAKTFQLEDVLYSADRKIVLVGRVFEYQEGKKKRQRFLDFSHYSIRIYDVTGKQLNEVNTSIDGKWLNSTKLMMGKGRELVLASFYSKEKRGATQGLLVQRIDPSTGNVIGTAEKEINYSMLNTDNAITEAEEENGEEDKESRTERKEREALEKIKDEGEGFSRYMIFRDIFHTSDNGLVILAEKYHHFRRTSSSYSSPTPAMNGVNGMAGSAGFQRMQTNFVYECGEILMCKVEPNHTIGWLQVVPKSQREVIIAEGGAITRQETLYFSSFFDPGSRPFYSGFGAMQVNKQIKLLFNDHAKNAGVTQPGQSLRRINAFGRSDCYVLSLDEVTGKFSRKVFFSNADVPTSMPRLGAVIGSDMYIVGKTDRLWGKSKLAVARISSK